MRKKGFTLVELMTVIVVLGIIILIAIPGISITLKESRKKAFKVTCDKVFKMDEKYELYQDLAGTDFECVIFDFDKNEEIPEQGIEIDGQWYEPLSKIGLENEEGLTGQYRVCKNNQMNLSNGEFTCVYDKNNNKLFSAKETKESIKIPDLLVTITPDIYEISVSVDSDNANKYYYKINNEKYEVSKKNEYTFKNLNPNTEYIIYVYVESDKGLRSEEKKYKVKTQRLPYTGIPENDYQPGDTVWYDGIEFLVVKDNGDNVTLITKYNQKVDKFGTTSSWNDSQVKSYLNNEWVSDKEIIKDDIENDGIIYSNNSSSYIRLIERNELIEQIPNGSNTLFWTMTSDGSDVYYALSNAAKKYSKYSTTPDQEVTYYQGTNEDLSEITKIFTKNNLEETKYDAKTLPTNTELTLKDAQNSITTTVSGKDNYEYNQRIVEEDCNCVVEEHGCTNVACNVTSYKTTNISVSSCITSTPKCTSTTGVSSCAGYNSTSCGKGGGGCTGGSTSSCASHSSSCYSSKNGTCANGEWYTYPDCASWTTYCAGYAPVTTSYCQAGCSGSTWDHNECAGYGTSECASYTTTKSKTTITTTVTSTCKTCESTNTTCETCSELKNIYDASGNNVVYNRYVVFDLSGELGIRPVITVRENSSIIETN